MRSVSHRSILVVALILAVALAVASPLFFPSVGKSVKVDASPAARVVRAASQALAGQEVAARRALKLEELVGFDTELSSLAKPVTEWLAPAGSQRVEQVASMGAEDERAGAR